MHLFYIQFLKNEEKQYLSRVSFIHAHHSELTISGLSPIDIIENGIESIDDAALSILFRTMSEGIAG